MMRLLVISHTPHYRSAEGIVGWGPTIREMDALAQIFESIVHIAPLYEEQPPASALPYTASNIRFSPVKPAGGDGLRNKINILFQYPRYFLTILWALRDAEAVHVRFPANISLLALIVLHLRKSPEIRWFKYAGNWMGYNGEPIAYRIQRMLLNSHLHGGVVTVNHAGNPREDYVEVFRNPSLTRDEYELAASAGAAKDLGQHVKLLFCGRMEESKGAHIVLDVIAKLEASGVPVQMTFIGDGPDLELLKTKHSILRLKSQIEYPGWVKPEKLSTYYRTAHFVLLPSRSEGWPKVLSEAMAWGVVPLASAVSSIPYVLSAAGSGRSIESRNAWDYFHALQTYIGDSLRWKKESLAAITFAEHYTFDRHISAVQSMILSHWAR